MVLAPDRVAIRVRRADGVGLAVVGEDAEVDGVGRVPDEHLGPLHGRAAVRRFELREAGEPHGLGPGGFIQHAVDDGRGLDARDRDLWPAAPLDDLRRCHGHLRGDQRCDERHGPAAPDAGGCVAPSRPRRRGGRQANVWGTGLEGEVR